MLELWHEWNSVHSFKVRVVLAEKGLAWQSRRLELLKFEHLQPQYLRLNPNGVVPTLVHDGRAILESSVICQYLDEQFPEPPLLPPDPYGRAQARAWLKYFDDVLHPALRAVSFERLYRPLLAALPREELERRLAAHPHPSRAKAFLEANPAPADLAPFTQAIERVESALHGQWLTGDCFGLADAALAPFAERLAHLGLDHLWAGHRKAAQWTERLLARACVQAAQAPPEFRFSRAY
ncbi:MAG TPA: glutathione S-transferase family protein [Burkholderiales bacterium]|jgi:glutathione S-transferase|nr:glutathione S-transferase family protein [Burkholderiales bacterium]